MGNWSLTEDRVTALSREYYGEFQRIGSERFTAGVSKIIHDSKYAYFPTISEFLSFVPMPKRGWIPEEEWEDLRRERAANPDAFFGEADAKAAWKIAVDRHLRKLPPLSSDQMIAAVLEVRGEAAVRRHTEGR